MRVATAVVQGDIDACANFAQQLGGKMPGVLERVRAGNVESLEALKLPKFRALMVRRLLAVVNIPLAMLYATNRV